MSWGGFFDYANRVSKVEQDKHLSLSPGFWDDNTRATATMKEIKLNEFWIKLYDQVETAVDDLIVLFDFWKEGDATEEETEIAFQAALKAVEEAEFKSTLNKPEDEMTAIIQINSGAGGTESQD